MDSDSAIEIRYNKKKTDVSSAPLISAQASNFEYPWILVFKWGVNAECPFQILEIDNLNERDYEPKWLSGILLPMSRNRQREMIYFPGMKISVIGKIEKRKFH